LAGEVDIPSHSSPHPTTASCRSRSLLRLDLFALFLKKLFFFVAPVVTVVYVTLRKETCAQEQTGDQKL